VYMKLAKETQAIGPYLQERQKMAITKAVKKRLKSSANLQTIRSEIKKAFIE